MKLFLKRRSDIRPPLADGGILLVECIVYMAVLSLVTGLSLAAYFRCETGSRQLRQNASDVGRIIEAGERWREDIRAASGRLELLESDGELRIPQPGGAVVYQYRDGVLARKSTQSSMLVLLKNLRTSRMFAEQRGPVTTWRWEVELRGEKKEPKIRPLFSFQAAPMSPHADNPK